MKIGSLKAWETMESGENITFPASEGNSLRTVTVELMAIAAEVTITDGIGAYPIGVINGYERLEFHIEDMPLTIVCENGACSYKTADLVEIGQLRLDGQEDASFTEAFHGREDTIDPAIKQLLHRRDARQRDREAYLMEYIEGLTGEIRNRANDGVPASKGGKAGAGEQPPGDAGEAEQPPAGVASPGGTPKPQGESKGDAKSSVGEQPKA